MYTSILPRNGIVHRRVSRWFVIPIAAKSPGFSFVPAIASAATAACDLQISSGSMFHPAGLRKELAEFLLGRETGLAFLVEQNRSRACGALIRSEYVPCTSYREEVTAHQHWSG